MIQGRGQWPFCFLPWVSLCFTHGYHKSGLQPSFYLLRWQKGFVTFCRQKVKKRICQKTPLTGCNKELLAKAYPFISWLSLWFIPILCFWRIFVSIAVIKTSLNLCTSLLTSSDKLSSFFALRIVDLKINCFWTWKTYSLSHGIRIRLTIWNLFFFRFSAEFSKKARFGFL